MERELFVRDDGEEFRAPRRPLAVKLSAVFFRGFLMQYRHLSALNSATTMLVRCHLALKRKNAAVPASRL